MTATTLWKHTEYKKFFASFFLGNIGDWFDFFALQIIFVHQFHANANGIVYMLAAYMVPMILLGSLAGSAADKFNKKWLLTITDLIAGIFTVALIFTHTMTMALIIIAVRSCIVAFNSPAQQSTSKNLLPDNLQLKASSYEKITFQLCRIIGPMLGAAVLAFATPQTCLGINACSFFVSVIILLFLHPIKERAKNNPQDDTDNLKESNFKLTLRLVKKSTVLRYLIPLLILAALFIMTVEMQMVILLHDIIPARPDLLGYVIGFSALGSVLSGYWLSKKEEIKQFGWYMVLSFACVAAGYAFMGQYQTSWPIASFLFASTVSGFGLGFIFVLQPYAIKREISGDKIGRITGVLSMIQGIAYGVGVAFGANLILWLGARSAFVTVAMACCVLGLLSFSLRNRMRAINV